MFNHSPLKFEQLTSQSTENGRVYNTPIGPLSSVTTILGKYTDKTFLDDWRERIGEDEANQITHQAGVRGTSVHLLAERYLNNEDNWKRDAMPFNLHSFNKIKPHLNKIETVYGTEVPLWSKFLQTAGRCDLICKYNGVNTILDFKTSKRAKEETHIKNYFLQATAYSLMTLERFDLFCPQIVILITVDHDEPQLFVKRINSYATETVKLFRKHYADTRKNSRKIAI